ncbi:biotin/lipoyl-binding protein [Parasulfuritortus cantonensis]|uniref:Biotin/lipoyl-binding protein n=1 Tax=Parasulfuritortus cantonensis TaxID=2528202 RepID=A0A4R1B5W4_9PROT|nr:efflux RND transporter periplasmic adaptor subunit [Parasulfuritortus cantonensis]TCJ12940.1 biotin/lipoyl-binding protein [Parasulfuritortus cantonensis]
MNRKLLIVPVLLALAAGAALLLKREHADPGDRLVLQGNVDVRQVDLAFDASGRVAEMRVQEGDRVGKGQVLARLDTTRLQLSLAQAEAQAAAQRSTLAKLRAGSRPEEIREAAAQRDAARVAVLDAEQVYKRQEDLVARNFVSQQQADSARNGLDAARQRLTAAEQAYRLAELGPRKEDIATAAAGLAAQEASVDLLRHDLAQGELTAPDDGVVESRILEPGDMASAAKPALTLALGNPLWVRVYLPEDALGRIPVGARASVTTDSRPGKSYQGWVGYVAPSAEFTPKTVETAELRTSLVYQARVFVCDAAGELRQGMPATVTIAYGQAAGAAAPACGKQP